jgi:serine/threonine-protein kinase
MSDAIDRLNAALEGRYRIERDLGEGGMAMVYLADDLRHNRKVAIKVLKPDLAAVVGGDRFLAEIQTTANLQHPHILPLFDSGEADGFLFFVMPYIDGETLRDRLNREKQLPVDEAVGIARSIASALAVAHEQGVIHRDIKPANILLSRGEPLVADFGIALAVTQAGGGRLTETGLSVGTPYYMSPEQATGDRDITASSDVYALGCILYEMLIGEPPYVGNTAQAVLGKILTEKPRQPTAVRTVIPLNVDGAVMRALEKLPADRFRTAEEFAKALGDSGFRYGESAAVESATGVNRESKFWRRLALFATIGAMILGWSLGRRVEGPAEPPPTTRSVFTMPRGQEILDRLYGVAGFARDGSALVYVGPGANGTQLWVKERGSHEARPLSGTSGAESPEIDPTGRWIAYINNGEVRKLPIAGGPSTVIGDSSQVDVGSIAWLDDGTLLYVDQEMGIRRIREDGTERERVFEAVNRGFTIGVTALPGGNALFGRCPTACQAGAELWVWDGEAGEARELDPSSLAGWWVDSGHLVLVRPGGGVYAVEFDLETLTYMGEPVPVLEGVQVDLGILPDMTVGPSGQLLALIGAEGSQSMAFHWIDREGVRTPVDPDFSFRASPLPRVTNPGTTFG